MVRGGKKGEREVFEMDVFVMFFVDEEGCGVWFVSRWRRRGG